MQSNPPYFALHYSSEYIYNCKGSHDGLVHLQKSRCLNKESESRSIGETFGFKIRSRYTLHFYSFLRFTFCRKFALLTFAFTLKVSF